MRSNEVLERFPVSRKIAFDPAKGRLWALRPRCRNWMAPIEERWEAVEDAERLFERATVLSSTENVTLGRLTEGTELVRIGQVQRAELAGWRYGNRFVGRAWKSQLLPYAVGATAFGFGMASFPFWPLYLTAAPLLVLYLNRPLALTEDGTAIRYGRGMDALLVPGSTADAWNLVFPRRSIARPWKEAEPLVLHGYEAIRILRVLLPRMNWGWSRGRPCLGGGRRGEAVRLAGAGPAWRGGQPGIRRRTG